MSFETYLANIRIKTGHGPDEFKKLAAKKGLLKPGIKAGEIIKWLKEDFDLGHGHAMAIYSVLKGMKTTAPDKEADLASHFKGDAVRWKKTYDEILHQLKMKGSDISVSPAKTYISLLRGDKKIAIVQVSAARMVIGIKLKGIATTTRFKAAGNWNTMVTHRVLLTQPSEADKELFNWLNRAYEQNEKK